MDPFEIVRRRASTTRRKAVSDDGPSEATGLQVALRLAEILGYDAIPRDADDPLLQGAEAVLDRGIEAIYYRASAEDAEAATLIAHEIGHLVLHAGLSLCHAEDFCGEMTEIDPETQESAGAIHRLDSYGARERQELQANVFARELLLPRDVARGLFLDQNLGAREIAERLCLPLELVRQQLADGLLLPIPEPAAEDPAEDPSKPLDLDPSQRAAAEHRGTPLLLEAGPGTGKTRTLVGRILSLVADGVDPASILALTFSNKAAQEIVDRVTARLDERAPSLFAGTFHAFGLEILRKHHDRVGLTPDLRVIDRADAVALLEDQLPGLRLEHHQNLYEPALDLKEILAAISRAKDELVDAAGYRALADRMLENADDDASRKTAEKSVEVARVYAAYEKTLQERGWVDFGDLVMVPTLLLEKEPSLRTHLRLRYRHILVDEYQDVNRASARMLKALAGSGERLWVVGDSRQSIYRFRGASTANMRLFSDDFDRAERRALATSYRSTEEIVGTFCSFARTMQASEGMLPLDLASHRGAFPADAEAGRPMLIEVTHAEDEVAAVAGRVQALVDAGVPLKDQAVLCRSNAQVEKFANGLAARSLPVLHLGSLFERDEIRDLLSLLSFVVDPRGGALARIAAMDEYAVPTADVEIFLAAVRGRMGEEEDAAEDTAEDAADREETAETTETKRWRPLDLLRCLANQPASESQDGEADDEDIDPGPMGDEARQAWRQYLLGALSDEGREGLLRLAEDLAGAAPVTTPWNLIADYLFDRSRHLRRRTELSLDGQMRGAALHQFLGFLKGARGHGRGFPAKRLLDRVRRLVLLGEERDLRHLPAAALHLDAVRLMTLHGSKGLEFEAVHLPSMSNGGLPSRFRSARCPPPHGLIAGLEVNEGEDPDRLLHDAEEECLFFVAMSRARTHLALFRATTAGRVRRKPSPFLAALRPEPYRLADPVLMPAGRKATSRRLEIVGREQLRRARARDLAAYERCPRQFFYSRILRLPGQRRDSAYQDTRRCLYALMRWLRGVEQPDAAQVATRCDEIWRATGPVGHAFERQYRELFGSLVEHLLVAGEDLTAGDPDEASVSLELNGHEVELQADWIGHGAEGGHVLRIARAGRKGSFKADQIIHGLWQQAVEERFGATARVEVVHLADGARTPVTLSRRQITTRLDKGSRLLADLAEGRFPTAPDSIKCPRCPYFFFCPTVPSGPVTLRPESGPGTGPNGSTQVGKKDGGEDGND